MTSTLYLGSGSPVHSFRHYVDDAFAATVDALLASTPAAGKDSDHRQCNFARLVNEYFSEMNFGQTDVHVDNERLKSYCTLTDFILDSLDQMRNLTVAFQTASPRSRIDWNLITVTSQLRTPAAHETGDLAVTRLISFCRSSSQNY